MKKFLSALVAAMLVLTLGASALAEVKVGQLICAAYGNQGFTIISVAVDGDKILDAQIDEFQMMGADVATGVPNSEAAIPVEGQVLASKRVNTEYYSGLMNSYAGSTVAIDVNFDTIEAFAAGMTIAELEAALAGKTDAEMVDAVAGCTLVGTIGYLSCILEAAKTVQ